jgi:Fe-S cluster assembly protein SufD
MNVIAPTGALAEAARGFLARYEAASLPDHAAARAESADLLRRAGLPGPREEAWHYTRIRPVADFAFADAAPGRAAALPAAIAALDLPRLVFVDGVFRAEMSRLPAGFEVATGAAAMGGLARPESEKLVALNTMLATDGAALRVAAGIDAGTLLLVSLGGEGEAGPVAFHPRHAIHLAAGASLTLIELATGEGRYLHNPVTSATLEADARLTHLRLQDEGAEAFHLSTLYADIAEGAEYDSFALTIGARLARMEVHARLAGPGAIAHLNAAQLLAGQQHADFTTVVRHAAPATQSRQTVKNVLTGRSHGVFQGKIEVDRIAQKTDGYQMNQALLLSPDAEINSKPQLEIYADDVKCSHGATVGALDDDQLFYLRSRGVPAADARAMLVRAFLAEALDPIAHEAGRGLLESAVEGWWERNRA